MSLYRMRKYAGVKGTHCRGCAQAGSKSTILEYDRTISKPFLDPSCPPLSEEDWENCECLVLHVAFVQEEDDKGDASAE